jgi:4-diphosphocytidyl-2-C-methyl-D-erythritol kinase
MLAFPNVKINLGLNIIEKRADGYHNLLSVFYPVKGLFDVLELHIDSGSQLETELCSTLQQSGKLVSPQPIEYTQYGKIKLAITGIEIPGSQADNLLVKAYNLIDADYGLAPVKVHLHKVIPHWGGFRWWLC